TGPTPPPTTGGGRVGVLVTRRIIPPAPSSPSFRGRPGGGLTSLPDKPPAAPHLPARRAAPAWCAATKYLVPSAPTPVQPDNPPRPHRDRPRNGHPAPQHSCARPATPAPWSHKAASAAASASAANRNSPSPAGALPPRN